jgi:hypothetical protein
VATSNDIIIIPLGNSGTEGEAVDDVVNVAVDVEIGVING